MVFRQLIAKSSCFKALLQLAEKYARSDWPILIVGESGVGKELLANFIHQKSKRQNKKMIALNCGAFPAGLFESELFGYEKGAFTGAQYSHKGLARMAHQGTLFLDEIGELEQLLQSKLLRLIELGEVRSVGSDKVDSIDVRYIAATNRPLISGASQFEFRWDLLQRLSVLTLEIPPLRERKEDILPIATEILDSLQASYCPTDLEILFTHNWPGNVRELKNLLIRVALVCNRTIRLIDLEKGISELTQKGCRSNTAVSAGTLAEIEKEVIVDRLRRFNGSRKKAAESLEISTSSLHEKIRRWKEDHTLGEDLMWPLRNCHGFIRQSRC